jgi:DNA-binding response OmpR family regulator
VSRILVVEDDEHLGEGVAFNLRNDGYDVEVVESGESALEVFALRRPDLILLDIMLPGMQCLAVLRRLRKAGHTQPVLVITALDRADDAFAGLDAGADDYITKPFDLDEVLARIRGALRRQVWHRSLSSPRPPQLKYGSWDVDLDNFRARSTDGAEVVLTAKEVGVLRYFAANPGELISREAFLEHVWGLPPTVQTRAIDNVVRKLRRTLESDPANPRHIISIRGGGYRFVP